MAECPTPPKPRPRRRMAQDVSPVAVKPQPKPRREIAGRSVPHAEFKALMHYESELITALLAGAPDSILKAAEMAQGNNLVDYGLLEQVPNAAGP